MGKVRLYLLDGVRQDSGFKVSARSLWLNGILVWEDGAKLYSEIDSLDTEPKPEVNKWLDFVSWVTSFPVHPLRPRGIYKPENTSVEADLDHGKPGFYKLQVKAKTLQEMHDFYRALRAGKAGDPVESYEAEQQRNPAQEDKLAQLLELKLRTGIDERIQIVTDSIAESAAKLAWVMKPWYVKAWSRVVAWFITDPDHIRNMYVQFLRKERERVREEIRKLLAERS